MRKLIVLLLVLFWSSQVWAAIYYTTQSGAGSQTGANCANAKSISWANTNASAGDIINICAGTITTTIDPANNGSSGNPITFQKDPDAAQWSAIIDTSSHGANMEDTDYIVFDGLYFYNTGVRWITSSSSNDANYITIQNCKFYDANAYSGILIYGTGWVVKDSIFPDADELANNCTYWDAACETAYNAYDDLPNDCNCETAPADIIKVSTGASKILITGNTFGYSSHAAVNMWRANDVVFRDNIVENKFHTATGNSTGTGYPARTLFENNIIKNGGQHHAKNPNPGSRTSNRFEHPAFQNSCEDSIIRYNTLYNNGAFIFVSAGSDGREADDQRIYHNSAYNHWRTFCLYGNNTSEVTGIITKNNIFNTSNEREVDNRTDYGSPINYFINNAWTPNEDTFYFKNTTVVYKCLESGGSGDCTNGYLESLYPTEWLSSNFYANPYWADPNNGDLGLTINSTALIDAATHLTQVNDAGGGSGTSMVVDDSLYFYDGWSISGETGDTIYVDNPSSADFEAVISSINYSTHTLTLTASKTWDDNALVYFCQSGTCFEGSAPDIGMNEYDSDPPSVTVPVPAGRMNTGGQGGFGAGYGRLQ